MPTLNLLGVTTESLSLRGKKNAFMLTASYSAGLSDVIANEMGWNEFLYDGDSLRENWQTVELESSVGSGEMSLTPNGRGMKDQAIGIQIAGASHFKAVRSGGEDTPMTRLHFKVKTAVQEAESILGQYWRARQDGVSKMKIVFAMQTKIAQPEPEAEAEGGLED